MLGVYIHFIGTSEVLMEVRVLCACRLFVLNFPLPPTSTTVLVVLSRRVVFLKASLLRAKSTKKPNLWFPKTFAAWSTNHVADTLLLRYANKCVE